MCYSSNMPYSSTERQDTPFLQYTTMMFFSSMRIGTMYVFYLNRVHPTQVSQPGRLTLHMSCLSSCYFRGQGEIKSTSIMNIYIYRSNLNLSTMSDNSNMLWLLFSNSFRYSRCICFACPLLEGHQKSSKGVLGSALRKWLAFPNLWGPMLAPWGPNLWGP